MQIPAKVFEYIRAERPILAIAPPGATTELLETVDGGSWVHPSDRLGMQKAILELIATRGKPFKRSEQELERFSRAYLTARLAEVLDASAGIRRASKQNDESPTRISEAKI
jgi:hypothetical protein